MRVDHRRRSAVQLIHAFTAPARIDVLAAALQLSDDAVEVFLHLPQGLVGINSLRQVVAISIKSVGNAMQSVLEVFHIRSRARGRRWNLILPSGSTGRHLSD